MDNHDFQATGGGTIGPSNAQFETNLNRSANVEPKDRSRFSDSQSRVKGRTLCRSRCSLPEAKAPSMGSIRTCLPDKVQERSREGQRRRRGPLKGSTKPEDMKQQGKDLLKDLFGRIMIPHGRRHVTDQFSHAIRRAIWLPNHGGGPCSPCGLFVAQSVGKLFGRWLSQQDLEPPLVYCSSAWLKPSWSSWASSSRLDQLGLQIAPLVAGLGVAGLGVGLALQGVSATSWPGCRSSSPSPIGSANTSLSWGFMATLRRSISSPPHSCIRIIPAIVIPNRKVVGEILHNFGTIRQLDLSVGVSYRTDIDKALGRLRGLVRRHPQVLSDPAPIIGIAAFADSSITLSVRPWVKVASVGSAQIELNHAILEQFRTEGVEIPFPQCEVRLLDPILTRADQPGVPGTMILRLLRATSMAILFDSVLGIN